MITGGCFCRYVRYEVTGAPFHMTSCHCSICRRISAAAFVTWFSVPRTAFRFAAGHATSFASSEVGTRSFCPRCGTPLTFEHAEFRDEIDVTTCSLDQPEQLPPTDHTHVSTQLTWVELNDELPRYPGARPTR
jgi:hypothetical protein